MKKIGSLILALALLFSLAACGGGGGGASDDPNVGTWNAVTATMLGIDMEVAGMFAKGVVLEIQSNGKFTLNVDGQKASGKWEYKGDSLIFSGSGAEMTATVSGGKLTLENLMDLGLDVVFEREGGYAGGTKTTSGTAATGDAGYYVIDRYVESDGTVITAAEIAVYGFEWYVLLNSDGSAVVDLDGAMIGTWKDGEIDFGDDGVMEYTIKGDVLTIAFDDESADFRRSNDTPPEVSTQPDPTPPISNTAFEDWWAGPWYGYWNIAMTTDGFSHLDNGKWDCYAVIDVAGDYGTIYVWDDEDVIATVDVAFYAGSGEPGVAISDSGAYWDGAKIGYADWSIDPSQSSSDDVIRIASRFESAESPGEGFNFYICLRPWGTIWDDFPESSRPPWHDDWYVDWCDDPMLEAIAAVNDGTGFIHPEVAR